MKFTPLGGGREIGANCYLINIAGLDILIDAGRHPVREGYESLPYIENLKKVDYIIVSHAHYDHLSSLPYIIKEFPNAKVITAKQNKDLSIRILRNSVEVMKKNYEKDGEPLLYNHKRVKETKRHIISLPYYKKQKLSKGAYVTLYPAGHVMGASSILIEHQKKRYFYTGDISLSDQYTIPAATLPEDIDVLISEGTYGLKEGYGATRFDELKRLNEKLASVLENKGRALLPVFALGRGQEVLHMVLKMMEDNKIPKVPIYINGMVLVITELYLKDYLGIEEEQREWFTESIAQHVKVMPKRIEPILNSNKPMILILSSGMLIEETLSYIFAKEIIKSGKNAVLFMGYQSPESNGYRLLEAHRNREEEIIFSENGEDFKPIELKSDVDIYNFSGHASYNELIQLPRDLQPSKLIYVHGDEEALLNLREELKYEFDIEIPANLEFIEF
ncbi:MAG: MBL fold metallo-hydrolase [Kosmotoga sp.]|nr:MAG: MBL fold metallo-hydrolase [Kosmotoga sp.]